MLKLFKIGLILLVLLTFMLVTTSLVYSHPPFSGRNADKGQYFVDKDKDGICDNYGKGMGKSFHNKRGKGYGPGDGTGNMGKRPKDGTGYGAKYDCPLSIKN